MSQELREKDGAVRDGHDFVFCSTCGREYDRFAGECPFCAEGQPAEFDEKGDRKTLHIEYHNISGDDGGNYGNEKFRTVKEAQDWLDHELVNATHEEIDDLVLDTFTANDENGNFVADLQGVG